MVTITNPLAKIAVNKSLLKEYSNSEYARVVYMKNNSEFQIQIFNPYDYTIGADISINGNRMSNRIIIKPGQRIWLERYIDEPRKFLFSTYEVENSAAAKSAIRNNGLVSISFYKEKLYKDNNVYIYNNHFDNPITTYYNKSFDFSPNYNNYCATDLTLNSVDTALTSTCAASASYSADTIQGTKSRSMCKKGLDTEFGAARHINATIETGRIEKGSHSNQEFENVFIDFEYWSFTTETIQILPESQKPYTDKDLKKVYCVNCGRKLNTKYKYCPYCGTVISY